MVKILLVDSVSAGSGAATGCCTLVWSHEELKWSE
jgi:hypothetical protein